MDTRRPVSTTDCRPARAREGVNMTDVSDGGLSLEGSPTHTTAVALRSGTDVAMLLPSFDEGAISGVIAVVR